MHDNALSATVELCMRRMLFHLLTAVSRAGAGIVYANTERIIIDTRRENMFEVKELAQHLLDALHVLPMFSAIDLVPTRVFKTLLFLDSINLGGTVVTSNVSVPAVIEEDNENDS